MTFGFQSIKNLLVSVALLWPVPFAVAGESVVLRFGGDCLLAEHYERAVGDDVSLAFRGFDLFETADIAMVNLECPVTQRGTKVEKPFNFRMQPRFLGALTSAGVDIVTIANNHIYDYGVLGLFDTMSYLDSVGIQYVGAGKNRQEAHTPVTVNIRGRRIAFLGYYGGGEAPAATRSTPGVARRDVRLIASDVRKIKSEDSTTFIVVNLHWGTEKAEYPDDEQIAFARRLVDSGVDAIIGHHPHVLQGIELYKSGIIAYSLGNLIFGGNSRSTYDTAVLELRLTEEGCEVEVIPVRVTGWNATHLTGADAGSVLSHLSALSRIFPNTIPTLKAGP